jgi:hypothetical protein
MTSYILHWFLNSIGGELIYMYYTDNCILFGFICIKVLYIFILVEYYFSKSVVSFFFKTKLSIAKYMIYLKTIQFFA